MRAGALFQINHVDPPLRELAGTNTYPNSESELDCQSIFFAVSGNADVIEQIRKFAARSISMLKIFEHCLLLRLRIGIDAEPCGDIFGEQFTEKSKLCKGGAGIINAIALR